MWTILLEDRTPYCTGSEEEQAKQLGHSCLSDTFDELVTAHLYAVARRNLSYEKFPLFAISTVRWRVLFYEQRGRHFEETRQLTPKQALTRKIWTSLREDRAPYCTGCAYEQPIKRSHSCLTENFGGLVTVYLFSVVRRTLAHENLIIFGFSSIRRWVELYEQRWRHTEEPLPPGSTHLDLIDLTGD